MTPCRIAHRVVSSLLPQNPCTFPISLWTSATKLFRRSASKGIILGPHFWSVSGSFGAQQREAGNGGVGVWLLARGCACRIVFALATSPSLSSRFIWATKENSVKGAR